MSSDQPVDRPPDATADRGKMNLQCVGSFSAFTQEGEAYIVDIFTHFGAVHDRERMRVQPTLLVLTTKDGRAVERVAQGEYRLSESPEISFSTADPNAP
jgi:hypothetical protein